MTDKTLKKLTDRVKATQAKPGCATKALVLQLVDILADQRQEIRLLSQELEQLRQEFDASREQ